MMSKISLGKLIKEDLKIRAWFAIVSSLAMLIVLPINFMLRLHSNQMFMLLPNGKSVDRKAVMEWVSSFLGYSSADLSMVIIVLAILCGITGFLFLHSREKLDFYHSLPVTREEKFLAQFLSGFFMFLIPFVISQILAYILAAMQGYMFPHMFRVFLGSVAYNVLFFLLIYNMTIFSFLITGKMIAAFFTMGVVFFIGTGVEQCFEMLGEFFLKTYVNSGYVPYDVWGSVLYGAKNPFLYYGVVGELLESGSKESGKAILIAAVVTVLLFAINMIVYKIRPTEGAGRFLAFAKSEPVIKVLVSVVGGIWAAGIINNTLGIGNDGFIAIAICIAAVICVAVEFIYHTDLKRAFSKKPSFIVTMVLATGILLGYEIDIIGYDRYLPELNEVSEISLDIPEFRDAFGYSFEEEYISEIKGDTVPVKKMMLDLAETGIKSSDENGEEIKETVDITIYYKMNNGKKKKRTYDIDQKIVLTKIDEICANTKGRVKLYEMENLSEKDFKNMIIYNLEGSVRQLNLNKSQREKLVEVYKQEILTLSIRDINESRFYVSLLSDTVECYVYDVMHKTLGLLKEYGYDIPMELNANKIQCINVLRYVDENTGEKRVMIDGEDKEAVEEILNNLTNCYGILEDVTDVDTEAEITFKNGEVGTFSFYRGKAPKM